MQPSASCTRRRGLQRGGHQARGAARATGPVHGVALFRPSPGTQRGVVDHTSVGVRGARLLLRNLRVTQIKRHRSEQTARQAGEQVQLSLLARPARAAPTGFAVAEPWVPLVTAPAHGNHPADQPAPPSPRCHRNDPTMTSRRTHAVAMVIQQPLMSTANGHHTAGPKEMEATRTVHLVPTTHSKARPAPLMRQDPVGPHSRILLKGHGRSRGDAPQ
jgi:hypothetical protein